MNDRELYDLLRTGDPARLGTTDGPTEPHGRQMLATIMARVATQDIAQAQRRRRRLIAAVIIVAAVTTAAAWLLSTRPVTDTGGVLCYAKPTLDTDAILVPFDGQPGVEVCIQVWADGHLPVVGPPLTDVPELVGCVLEGETLAVFPSANPALCEQLGLGYPDGSNSIDPIAELEDRLAAAINQTTCLSLEQAEAEVRAHLDELDLTDWQITSQPADPARPCASFGIEAPDQLVFLVPIPAE